MSEPTPPEPPAKAAEPDTPDTPATPEITAERLLRDLAPRALGVVVRRWRDFAACEDAVQEALIAAAARWPRGGVPANPLGWLVQVAQRRLVDQLRSEEARRQREARFAAEAPVAEVPEGDPMDTLVLLFMCCHPALSPASAVALTLRAVGGLTTAEIASAFLVPVGTMAQRISRAKQTIKASRVPFRMPDARQRGRRLGAVLQVLYLVFNEGYTTSGGADLQRTDLASEAIRLTRAVHRLLPGDGEVTGLLALMLLTDARRAARTGPDGELIPLDEQDRTRWDAAAIAEGVELAAAALRRAPLGEYQLQAAIAALHDQAARPADTDWPQIAALYGLLRVLSGNPMAALSHAVASAEVHGPQAGLDLLADLDADERLHGHHRLDAVRAHLLERAGDRQGAVAHYRAAAAKTTNLPERDYLLKRAARLDEIA